MPRGMAFWGFLTSSPVSGKTQPRKARQQGPSTNPRGAWGFPVPGEPRPPRATPIVPGPPGFGGTGSPR